MDFIAEDLTCDHFLVYLGCSGGEERVRKRRAVERREIGS